MRDAPLLNLVLGVVLAIALGWLLMIGQAILLPILAAVITVYIIVTASGALATLPGMRRLPITVPRFLVLLLFTLVVVVTITGIFSYYQDAKSASIMEGFKSMVPGKAHVRRNGQVLDINSEDLVRGDIVTVGPGDKIPADIRIMECSGLKVCWWWLCLLLVDGGWNYYLSSTAVPSPPPWSNACLC